MHRNKHTFTPRENNILSAVLTVLVIAMVFGHLGMGVVTASAETTYMINDNGRVSYYTTSATDPEEVLDLAGLELGIDDTYTTEESIGYTGIFVKRVQMVTIDNGGQILKTGTYGETVEQLLTRLNMKLGEDDQISVALDAETYDGMEIVIDRVTYVTEVYSRTLSYEIEYIADAELPEGEEQVITAGCDGEELCTAMVTYENGQETHRNVIRTRTTQEPVNRVIAVGTAMAREAVSGELSIGDGIIITAEGDVLTYTKCVNVLATAYTCEATGGIGITATGTPARVGAIAVDPTVIPYGTRMFIVSSDGEYIYGVATAEDCGHPDFICGYRIDLYMDTEYECIQFGARDCQVYILG